MKTPRPFTLRDTTGACLAMSGEPMIPEVIENRKLAQLALVNALNDMTPNLAGFDQLPYLPGDLIACKLNLVKLKKPRRNPWYRPALCPCDKRAARNNAS